MIKREVVGGKMCTVAELLDGSGGLRLVFDNGDTAIAYPSAINVKKYSPDQPRDDHGRFGSGFKACTPDEFIAARDTSTRTPFLSAHTADELAGHRLFLSKDGKVGYALDDHDDLQNVFNNGGPKGSGKLAIADAIARGAKTLDCFDGYLPDLYSKAGFEAYGRVPFDDDYASPSWDYASDGRPHVVFMHYVGGARTYVKNSGKLYSDYDTAKADGRTAAVAKGVAPGSPGDG